MITIKGLINRAVKEMLTLLKEENKLDEYKKLRREFKRSNTGSVLIFKDSCREYPETNTFYTAEVFKELPDGLVFVTSGTTLEDVFNELKRYLYED